MPYPLGHSGLRVQDTAIVLNKRVYQLYFKKPNKNNFTTQIIMKNNLEYNEKIDSLVDNCSKSYLWTYSILEIIWSAN